ncbi:MAG TPA: hypothetical protein VFE23_10615 [Usitatibacter sp.]|jgi:hypothetical protein|nr:hypothetical protein [Usitatibacter sp.]
MKRKPGRPRKSSAPRSASRQNKNVSATELIATAASFASVLEGIVSAQRATTTCLWALIASHPQPEKFISLLERGRGAAGADMPSRRRLLMEQHLDALTRAAFPDSDKSKTH